MSSRKELEMMEVQRMSAGTGILHSEFDPSPAAPVHLLQIWIRPDHEGSEPSYEQHAFRGLDLRRDPGYH
jgi:redox-sensitive bicupin YhaK (pirin superfamily)